MGLLLGHIISVLCECHTSTCLEWKGLKQLQAIQLQRTDTTTLGTFPLCTHGYLIYSKSVLYIAEHGLALPLLCFGRIILLHVVTKLQNSVEVENELQLLRLFEDLRNHCHPGLDTTEGKCLCCSDFHVALFSAI